MGFWEKTWRERSEVIRQAYSDTWPAATVTSFSWSDRIRCPGACALALPPVEETRDPKRYRRDDWLYLTMGLSQPLDEEQVRLERAALKRYSAFGVEFALIVPSESNWPAQALYQFITHMTDGERINWGDRFPFGFHRRNDGNLAVYTGDIAGTSIELIGKIRAALFWRFLFPDWKFTTSTGKFMVLAATGITEAEWRLAKATSSNHLMLLLFRAGIAQRRIPDRECLLDDPKWQAEWETIKSFTPPQCDAEIEAGIGRWHAAPN